MGKGVHSALQDFKWNSHKYDVGFSTNGTNVELQIPQIGSKGDGLGLQMGQDMANITKDP